MICQECQERQASLHFTKIINGEKTEFHLCEACAKEKGEALPGLNNSFSIHQLLSGFLDKDHEGKIGSSLSRPGLRCSNCGLTYAQFSSSGRFGCAGCYKSFGDRLDPLFRKVHGGHMQHHGKVPQRSESKLKLRREIELHREQLQQAIQNEAFEQAAGLRDKIRDLERELQDE